MSVKVNPDTGRVHIGKSYLKIRGGNCVLKEENPCRFIISGELPELDLLMNTVK